MGKTLTTLEKIPNWVWIFDPEGLSCGTASGIQRRRGRGDPWEPGRLAFRGNPRPTSSDCLFLVRPSRPLRGLVCAGGCRGS